VTGPLNEKQQRYLGHVQRDAQHLLEVINDILDLSKIEAGQMDLHVESFDASEVIGDAVNAMRPIAAAKGLVLENRVNDETIVKADRVRFREIINNLLTNAVKFTPHGGNVLAESRKPEGGIVSFCVTDTGIGIAAEDHEAVFDKFRQVGSATSAVQEGTGLGLAIVKRLIELHGGTISLESAPGKGSQFSFTIPAGDSTD
jgi:signal transduction histidine kinase